MLDVMPTWTLDQLAGIVFGVRAAPTIVLVRTRQTAQTQTPQAGQQGSCARTEASVALARCLLQAGMLAAILSARYVDDWVAKQQRKQLGLCETCGGVYDPATCSQDKCPMKNKQ